MNCDDFRKESLVLLQLSEGSSLGLCVSFKLITQAESVALCL